MKLEGAWTAIVTPFNQDLTVDWDGLRKNVEFQIASGIDGIVPVGTTGESPTLAWNEHDDVIVRAIQWCGGKIKTLAGTGSNSTEEALRSTKHAVEAGANAVLMVDCYYNGPSSQELRDQYYGVVASAFPNTTVVPYVIPGRSGTALCVEDLAILHGRHPNISAVKEATGDLTRMAKTRSLLGGDFSIMSGDDDITYKMISDSSIRANGVISVMSNVAPAAVAQMTREAISGDLEAAAKTRDSLAPLLGIVTVKVPNQRVLPSGETAEVEDRYRNPLAIKTLMAGLGMPSGPCRMPLGKMSMAGVDVVRNAARQVWERSPEVLWPVGEFYGVDVAARLADDLIWRSPAL